MLIKKKPKLMKISTNGFWVNPLGDLNATVADQAELRLIEVT